MDHFRGTRPYELDESSAGELAAKGPSAFDAVLERERRNALTDRLESLPAIYREALSLRFEEEMTFEEMASKRKAIQAIRPGVTAATVDAAARKTIEVAGYGRQFGHGLGHGIGLEVHELLNVGTGLPRAVGVAGEHSLRVVYE